ncbi:MAG TPA: ABC transporter substrate-binding protein, partial [Aestuariivirga sp.]|nr:ABC transporter substrate-binding protein [Aestuariivirga sp.]
MKIVNTGMQGSIFLPIGRRKFLQSAAAMGLLQAGVISSLAAAPKKGGRLRIGCTGGSTNDTLDPALILDVYMGQVSFGQLRNCLTEIAADGSLVPELADSWEASPDAKIWTFKIRQGVEFHNGKSLTSADVVASINHHRAPDSKSTAKDIVKVITDIKTDGENGVVMTLDAG